MNLYNLIFRMVFLLYDNLNKMSTNGGGRVGRQYGDNLMQAILSRVEIPTWFFCFPLIFVRIHTNEFMQLLYKLCSTNSYTVWFLYQFVHFLYKLYSTNSYNEPRARSASREGGKARAHLLPRSGRTRLPRPLGYTRLPRPVRVRSLPRQLGYTRLSRPVRVRSWGTYVCRLLLGRNSK
jgi:hypothetical protein